MNDIKKEKQKCEKRVIELNNTVECLLNLPDKLDKLKIKDEEEIFWKELLLVAFNLIKVVDYGSVYRYIDGKVKFVDTVGHNLKLLQQLEIKKESFQLNKRENHVFVANRILDKTKNTVDNLTYKEIKKATLDINETMTFDLYFNGKAVGGISLDIKKGKEKKFNEIDKRLLRFLLHISKSFYSKDMEKKYRMQQAYFQQLFDKSTEAIALLDNNGRIIKINKSYKNLFGYSYKESKGINIDKLIVPDNKKEEGLKYLNKIINEKEIEVEAVRKNKFGGNIDVSLHAFPIKLDYGQIGIYAIYNDISKRKKEEARIKYLSFHDHLTGLYNRRFFNIEMQRLDNSRHLPISIIVADINDLKYINDKYGHTIGDRYIKLVANILINITRSDDIVSRVGGDEYAIILIENGLKETKSFLDRINNNIKKYNIKNNLPEKLNIALGFSIKKKKEENLFKIFEKADKEMYKRKIKMKRENKKY